ncbi:MAG: DNA-binding response regulator [Pseudonocardiales bacterium]|nr:MAG: DNA-binding response regulator [Pseudonocardiales bacterium]
MIRVLLVDDDPLLRAGLRLMLRNAADIEVVGEAADGHEALTTACATRPDVILMDIRMPGTDGIAATSHMNTWPDRPRIIVLTTFDADELVHRAIRAGADGYLVKDTPPAEIAAAIRSAAAGHAILSPAVTRSVITALQQQQSPQPATAPKDQLAGLTARERDVATAIASGRSNIEIAADLYLSVATVKAAVSRILTKLTLTNRTQIAITAAEAASHPPRATEPRPE